jgi:hypothetical protein
MVPPEFRLPGQIVAFDDPVVVGRWNLTVSNRARALDGGNDDSRVPGSKTSASAEADA